MRLHAKNCAPLLKYRLLRLFQLLTFKVARVRRFDKRSALCRVSRISLHFRWDQDRFAHAV